MAEDDEFGRGKHTDHFMTKAEVVHATHWLNNAGFVLQQRWGAQILYWFRNGSQNVVWQASNKAKLHDVDHRVTFKWPPYDDKPCHKSLCFCMGV